MHVCSFTNATMADLKASLRNDNGILCTLRHDPHVSTFDMSENAWLVDIIESLENRKLIMPVKTKYPWHRWQLTQDGVNAITA